MEPPPESVAGYATPPRPAGNATPGADSADAAWGLEKISPGASSATVYSADRAWGLQSPGGESLTLLSPALSSKNWKECSIEELRDSMMELVPRIAEVHGGVMQYLEKRYESKEERDLYAKKLWSYFPRLADQDMTFWGEISSTTSEARTKEHQQNLHLAMLRFDTKGTGHEPTPKPVAIKLIDEFMTHTFITNGDPLLEIAGTEDERVLAPFKATPPWTSEPRCGVQGPPVEAFSVAHHKAANRVATLHFLVTTLFDDNICLKAIHPSLYESIRNIEVVNLRFATKRDEIFGNFILSHRGEIRKPPSILTWVFSLKKLRDEYSDSDAGAVIRQWNSKVTRAGQLQGGKAQGVKNVLELMPEEAWLVVLADESRHGRENSPYTDELMASKKIYPGSHFKAAHCKAWTSRMTITRQSVLVFVKRVSAEWEKTPQFLRRRYVKGVGEEIAMKAAVVVNMAKEVQEIAPIPDEVLQQEWIDKWVAQDPQIDLAVESAVVSKDANFAVRQVKILHDIIEKHQKGLDGNVTFADSEEVAVQSAAAKLEEDQYALIMKEASHDEKGLECAHEEHLQLPKSLCCQGTGVEYCPAQTQ